MAEKIRILVVDDEINIRRTLTVILEDEGYEVNTAENGLEALAKAKKSFFNLAMIDVKLPRMNGLEVMRELKKVSSETISLMITGYATIESCIKAMNEGAYAYITKPLSIDEIKAVVGKATESQRIALEKKRLEKKIRESEKKYRDLFENANDAIFTLDEKGNFTSLNKKTEEISGYKRDKLLGKSFSSLLSKKEKSFDSTFQQILEGKSKSYEIEIKKKEGEIRILEVTTRPIKKAGKTLGVESIARDITERKKAEQQLIQSEKLRALGQMAGGVAHDFNNLLASVLGNVQLVLRQKKQLGKKEIEKRLQSIENSAMDGARVVRHIQDFSLKETGRKFTSLNLNKVIKNVVQMTKPKWKDEAEERGIPIKVIMKLKDIPSINGDISELREVLTNLIFNALDAMPQGGKIIISTAARMRKEGLGEESSFVQVSVKDTGIGMSEEVKRRVFDPFFTTKGVKRTGMGLSISYGIIKRHKGKIDIKTKKGKGTTFTLKFPLSLKAKSPPQPSTLPQKINKKAKILVIDDEKSVAEVLSEFLSIEGHEVKLALTARKGLTILRKDGFDLVFTDLGMPEISGWELAKKIKAMSPGLPVILITGWRVQLDDVKIKEAGVDLVVNKPFTFDEILFSVKEALKLKETACLSA